MPSRRDVLRLGGATLALAAGCVARSPSGADALDSATETSSTPKTPETTTQTAEPTPEADVRLRNLTVTPSLVVPNYPDAVTTLGERDEQFVVASVESGGSLPFARDEYEVVAGGETYAPTPPEEVTYGYRWLEGYGAPYEPEEGGFLVFSLPKPLDAESVSLRWPNDEHRLGDARLRRLRLPPTTFEVSAFHAPASVANLSEMTLTVTAENVGDADGTFVGALNRSGPEVEVMPVEAISLDVAAGDSATWTHSYAPMVSPFEEGLSITFSMDWRGGDERSRTALKPEPE